MLIASHNDVESACLGLTFSGSYERFGAQEEHELVPGGKDKEVTNENKAEYVR